MKKNMMIAAVIAASLTLASCGDFNMPSPETAAATAPAAVSAPAEQSPEEPADQSDSAPADDTQSEDEKAVTTTVKKTDSSAETSDDSLEKLKNTTITVKTPETAVSQNSPSESDTSSRPFRLVATAQQSAVGSLNDMEETAAGVYADRNVYYNSDFEVTDNSEECVYYKLDREFFEQFEGNIDSYIHAMTDNNIDRNFTNSLDVLNKLRGNIAGFDGSFYILADRVNNDYMIYSFTDETDEYYDPFQLVEDCDSYTFSVRISSANGTDYGVHTATVINTCPQGEGYHGILYGID